MAKVLITGAKGQLGQCLMDAASCFPVHRVVGCDIDQVDICEPDTVYRVAKADNVKVVINCAAFTNVDKAEENPDIACETNEKGVQRLTDVCDQLGALLVHLSTDYVFDGMASLPYRENDKPHPISVYGASKLAGERYVLSYGRGVVVRTSWLYSPYGHNFVATILRLGAVRQEIEVVNDQTGSPTYAPHLAEAILQMVEKIECSTAPESLMGLYHFSNRGQCTRFEFAQKIKEQALFGARIVPIPTSAYPTPARRPAYSVLDTQKITETFAIVPPVWEDGLNSFFTWKTIEIVQPLGYRDRLTKRPKEW